MSDVFANHFRQGDGSVTVEPVFTNRYHERCAYQSFREHHAEWRRTLDPLDASEARHNILNFYGIGGIGKSTLLRELKRSCQEVVPAGLTAAHLIDFQDSNSFNIEDIVLRIRTAVGHLGIPTSAFDVALSYYWSTVHPDCALDSYTRSSGVLNRAAEKVGLSGSIRRSLTEVGEALSSVSAVAGAGARLAHVVAKKLREQGRYRHAIEGCGILSMFLDPSNVRESLPYLPSLLAWDLKQAGDPEVVMFFDTYEEVPQRPIGFEQELQTICYTLPNAQFVIAGRNRLRWSQENSVGMLPYPGRNHWPDLADAGKATVLVGQLSDEDADSYLVDRVRKKGQAAIPAQVRNQIVAAAGGWPLYLDISASQFQQATAEGSANSGLFGGPFPALVARVLSDLSPDERRVVRSAALLDTFDERLVRAGAAPVSNAAVLAIVERPFVQRTDSQLRPYALHETLRASLRREGGEQGWTDIDWEEAAQRIVDVLAADCSTFDSRDRLGLCLDQGLRLSHEFDLATEWASAPARRLAACGGLESIGRLSGKTSSAQALERLLHVVAQRGGISFARHAAALDDCVVEELNVEDRWWAQLLRADALLSAGDQEAASLVYRQILEIPVEKGLEREAKTMYAICLLKAGDYTELAQEIAAGPNHVDTSRLSGDLYRFHARWADASAAYEVGLAEARSTGDVGLETLFRSELALIDGWTGREDPCRWSEDWENGSEAWPLYADLMAVALYHADRDPSVSEMILTEADLLCREFGLADGRIEITVARAFVAAVQDDWEGFEVLRAKAGIEIDVLNQMEAWLDILSWWAGDDEFRISARWVGGPQDSRTAWRAVLLQRQIRNRKGRR